MINPHITAIAVKDEKTLILTYEDGYSGECSLDTFKDIFNDLARKKDELNSAIQTLIDLKQKQEASGYIGFN